jgi:hypothetical protein
MERAGSFWSHPLARRKSFWVVLSLVAAGTALDLLSSGVNDWFASHQFATTAVSEALLIAAVFLGLDYLVATTENQRWREASREALTLLFHYVNGLDDGIRAAYDNDGQLRSTDEREWALSALNVVKDEIRKLQPLLTASPSMVQFLPATHDVESKAEFVLMQKATTMAEGMIPKQSSQSNFESYDKAVDAFIRQYAEVVPVEYVKGRMGVENRRRSSSTTQVASPSRTS